MKLPKCFLLVLMLTACEDAGAKALRLERERDLSCGSIEHEQNRYSWLLDSMAGGRWDGKRQFTPRQGKAAGLDSLSALINDYEERCAKASRAYNKFMR